MIKAALCAVLLLGCPLFLTGELLVPFNDPDPIVTGNVEDPLLFQVDTGIWFFVYTQNSALVVKRSPDNGATFTVVTPDYGEALLTDISSLRLLKHQGNSGLVFFQAEAGGIAGVYCLQLTKEGTAKLVTTVSLDNPGLEGVLGAYSVIPAPMGYVIVYHKGNYLGITRLKPDFSSSYLSAECPGIEKLELRLTFKAGPPLYCGVLERLVGSEKHIDYYEFDGTTLAVKPILNMPAAVLTQQQLIMAPDGTAWAVYLTGGKIYGKGLADGNWVGLNEDNSLFAAGGMDSFNFFILADILYLFGYAPDGSGYKVYGCTIGTTNIVKQMKSGSMLTAAAIKDRVSFAPLKDGNILIQYQELVSGNFGIQKYNRSSDTLAAYSVTIPGTLISAGFFHYRPFNWLLVANTLAAGKNKAVIYEYNYAEDKYQFKQETVIFEDSVATPGEAIGYNIHLFNTADGKLIHDASTNKSSIVESAYAVQFSESLYGDAFILLEKDGECFLRKMNREAQG